MEEANHSDRMNVKQAEKKPEFTNLSFEYVEASSELKAVLSSSFEYENINQTYISELLKKHQYDTFYFESNAIKILLDKVKKHEHGSFVLAKKVDATVKINVAKDKMQASITVTPAFGGKPLCKTDLVAYLKEANISPKRCNGSVLSEVIKNQNAKDVVFATGLAPINGEDAKFEPLVKSTVESGPRIDSKGIAHLRDIKEFIIVDVGKPLMRRTPHTSGESGTNVFGEPVLPKPGKNIQFLIENTGTMTSPEDENLLIAKVKGSPLVFANGVKIDEVIKFGDIDLHTGNVRVDSSIFIDGNVRQGMSVIASGSVIISGYVHNATVISGESIHIEGGVIGCKISEEGALGEKATVKLSAKKDIHANYVTLGILTAENDVVIKEYVTTSDIEAKGKVLVGQDGGKGQIIGGRTNAKLGIELSVCGSKSGVNTKLTVGLPLILKAKLKKILAEQEKAQKEVDQARFNLAKLEDPKQKQEFISEGLIKDSKLKLKKLELNLKRLEQDMSLIDSELATLNTAAIKVSKHIYEDSIFNINGVKLSFHEEALGAATYVRYGKTIIKS
ncbi:MAG: DUF342 domain-containing protein [Flavobacteriales bacterium]|nr:DUF342 domain-containing protein [Flavobacteriales bacterium]